MTGGTGGVTVLGIVAPDDNGRGVGIPEGVDSDRCGRCNRPIKWRAVVEVRDGDDVRGAVFGLTCAGVAMSAAKKRYIAQANRSRFGFASHAGGLPHPSRARAAAGETRLDWYDWAAQHAPNRALAFFGHYLTEEVIRRGPPNLARSARIALDLRRYGLPVAWNLKRDPMGTAHDGPPTAREAREREFADLQTIMTGSLTIDGGRCDE